MADQNSIADQWRGLNTQERDEALSRMTPDQKTRLAASLGYKEGGTPGTSAIHPEARTVGNYLSEAVRGAGRGLKDDIVGLATAAADPTQAITDLAQQTYTAGSKAAKEFRDTSAAPLYQRGVAAALTGLENAPMVGGMVQHAEQGGGRMASPESVGAAAEGIAAFGAPELAGRVIPRVADVIKTGASKTADVMAGTGPKVTGDLAKETAEANEAAKAKAEKTNAEQAARRKVDLSKHFEKTEAVKAENAAKEGDVSRRKAIERGVEQKDVEFQGELKETAQNVKATADSKYNAVREALGPKKDPVTGEPIPGTEPTVPSSELAKAVNDAEKKLEGSSENLKVFRDILSKHPESDPDFIPYQGASIPKGHPLYDVLKEQGQASGANPATFSDLQGYYTELGDKLLAGNLPGDVYQAMKSLHESVGSLMQKMADENKVGPQLRDAQQFYRGYMQTFRDSTSPLYKAIKASERGKAIKALSGKDQTGIQALARYNPDLAQKANTLRGYQQEAAALPKKVLVAKALPKLAGKSEPVVPETKTIGAEDIRRAKTDALYKQAERIRKGSPHIANALVVLDAIRNAMHGNVAGMAEDVGARAIYGVGKQAVANVLESPWVVDWLTKATPEDVAQIPSDMRGDISSVVQAAQAKGIRVSPSLTAAVAGAAIAGQPRSSVAAALAPR